MLDHKNLLYLPLETSLLFCHKAVKLVIDLYVEPNQPCHGKAKIKIVTGLNCLSVNYQERKSIIIYTHTCVDFIYFSVDIRVFIKYLVVMQEQIDGTKISRFSIIMWARKRQFQGRKGLLLIRYLKIFC